jgi:hypothetical protein
MNVTELNRSPSNVRASRATSVAPLQSTSFNDSAAGSNRLGAYITTESP